MSEGDDLWRKVASTYESWGLSEIPFSESASILSQDLLHEVFTGRKTELEEVINLLRGRERKRLLIYGWVGIGKTAFILEILGILQRNAKNTLTTYISLPPEIDLATTALIALARAMPYDEWAQHQLNQMGLPPNRPIRQRKSTVKADLGIGAAMEEQTVPVNMPKFPTLSFEDLLGRALQKYDKVVIAIDDLDKQDPARARQMLHDAQGMLKGGAWFILTGHPSGLTRDILISERGLFDLCLKLEAMDRATTYRMLVNYLNSARSKNARYNLDNPQAVYPFTSETASILCERSGGVPRWLNRLGTYVLLKASELQAKIITNDVLNQGLEYADQQLRGQPGLTAEDYYVLDLILEKGIISDVTLTLEDLERLKVEEFNEIIPNLDKLIQKDLIRRLPTELAAEYKPTPLLLGGEEEIET